MKKFWNLMLAALVIIGAAACTENYEGVDVAESLSFYAEIGNDDTRAYIEKDGEQWKTTFEGNETLYVNDFAFKNTKENPGKFTCTAVGVSKLAGQEVTITTDGKHHSLEGKSAFYTTATVKNFGAETVKLQAHTSFFRFTYNGEGKVKISWHEDNTSFFRNEEGTALQEVEVSGKNEEQFVAFWPTGEEVTLSYAVNGEVVKVVKKSFVAGMVYNLGTLAEEPVKTTVYLVPGTWSSDSPNFSVYYWRGGYNNEVIMVKDDMKSGVYKADVLASAEGLLFKRLNPADNSEWNKTADLTLPTDSKNHYYVTGWNTTDGEWREYVAKEWALAGNFNNWGNTVMSKTETANLFVAKGVELSTGTAIKVKDAATWDTSYGGGITNLEPNKWMTVYSNGADIVIAKSGMYDVYFQYATSPKLYLVEAEGDYTAAVEQTANGTLVPDGGDEPDQPAVTPGEKSEWALVGAFSSWADKTMLTTTDADVVVLENVALKAAEGFLVRKPATDWADKYGAGNVNYIKADHYITTAQNGADMCLEADGTYDIYFNITTKNLYVMTAGTDYANATQQTVSGEEPKQEEPEVTEKVVYLKPNSNWTQSNARFAAYFWGGTAGEIWVSMTACGDGTYEVHIPEGYDYGCNIIFARMNPSTTANNWNNKWNQSSDLKTPTDGKNLYTVKANTWDKGGGTWSVK